MASFIEQLDTRPLPPFAVAETAQTNPQTDQLAEDANFGVGGLPQVDMFAHNKSGIAYQAIEADVDPINALTRFPLCASNSTKLGWLNLSYQVNQFRLGMPFATSRQCAGRTPGPAQDRGACRSSGGRPHRPRHVQVGLTIVFVLAAGNEVTS
jgi:hypothetical protein